MFHKDSFSMKVMTWLADMLHIQILWVLGCLSGLIVLGVFPAVFAMFSIMREIIHKSRAFSFNRKFILEYKTNFIKTNLYGYGLLSIVGILVIYFRMTLNVEHALSVLFLFLGYGMIVLFSIALLYFPAVYAHYELHIVQLIGHSFVIMAACPLNTLGMVGALLGLYVIHSELPILTPFVSVAMFAYALTYIANKAFTKLTPKLVQPV